MLHDRVLVSLEGESGERHTGGGILIPSTVSVGKRLSWGEAVAIGHNVRQVHVGDRVLFDREDRSEVELHGKDYVLCASATSTRSPRRGSRTDRRGSTSEVTTPGHAGTAGAHPVGHGCRLYVDPRQPAGLPRAGAPAVRRPGGVPRAGVAGPPGQRPRRGARDPAGQRPPLDQEHRAVRRPGDGDRAGSARGQR